MAVRDSTEQLRTSPYKLWEEEKTDDRPVRMNSGYLNTNQKSPSRRCSCRQAERTNRAPKAFPGQQGRNADHRDKLTFDCENSAGVLLFAPNLVSCPSWMLFEISVTLLKISVNCCFCFIRRFVITVVNYCARAMPLNADSITFRRSWRTGLDSVTALHA